MPLLRLPSHEPLWQGCGQQRLSGARPQSAAGGRAGLHPSLFHRLRGQHWGGKIQRRLTRGPYRTDRPSPRRDGRGLGEAGAGAAREGGLGDPRSPARGEPGFHGRGRAGQRPQSAKCSRQPHPPGDAGELDPPSRGESAHHPERPASRRDQLAASACGELRRVSTTRPIARPGTFCRDGCLRRRWHLVCPDEGSVSPGRV